MVRHIEDSITVWFGMQIGSNLLKNCTVFAFRLKCGGNVSETLVHVHQTTFLGASSQDC